MLPGPLLIPETNSGPSYAYRDARRGSVDGAELLAPWAGGELGGDLLPKVHEDDVLDLLNEKWYGPCGEEDLQTEGSQRTSSLASSSSSYQRDSRSPSSSQSRRRARQGSTSSGSSAPAGSSGRSQSTVLHLTNEHHDSPVVSQRKSSGHRAATQGPANGTTYISGVPKSADLAWGSSIFPAPPKQPSQQSLLAALGTWTKRMTLFTSKQDQPAGTSPAKHPKGSSPARTSGSLGKPSQPMQCSPESWKSCHSGLHPRSAPDIPAASAPVPTRASAQHAPQAFGSHQTSEDDEDQTQAAWRWRFNRRWAREQARQFQADHEDEDESNWDDVLGFMDACGRPGWQLQIARSGSTDGLLSQNSEAGAVLLDGSLPEGNSRNSEATRKVIAMARAAQHLQQQQLLLEHQAEQRWSGAAPARAWVGSMIPAVRADHFGSYVFVLARVTPTANVKVGSSGRQGKLVLRGKAGLCEGRLIDALNQELVQTMSTHCLPKVGLSLLGSGTLSWDYGKDHGVQILPGRIMPGGDKEVSSVTSLVQLASELLRVSLPQHVQVAVQEAS